MEVATKGELGKRDAPEVEVDQADETVDTTAVSKAEEPENATDAVPRVTVWRGGGMRRVIAQEKGPTGGRRNRHTEHRTRA